MKKIFTILMVTAGIFQVSAQDKFPNPSITILPDNSADIKVCIASNNGGNALEPGFISFGNGADVKLDGTITLNTTDFKQNIDGFGFAITGSTAFNLMKMKEADRKTLLTQTFSPIHGYGCSYVRVPIGCSDFSLSQYTCCDKEGIENFSLTNEENLYIIPVLKEILEINPGLKIISAPWTAPRWMKVNNLHEMQPTTSWTGGNLNPKYYDDYAQYFVKWINAFGDDGISIYAITPQNEPLNTGNSASMYMSWTEARDFIKSSLGPAFSNAGLKTKIYVFDHNFDYDNNSGEFQYPAKIYADQEASKYIAGAAYHNYSGHPSEMGNIHNKYPEKELIFTEATAGTWTSPGPGMDGITTDAQTFIFDNLNNWAQGSIVWNFLLDSDRGPYRPGGCDTANGAVDIDKATYSNLTFNSFYYVICAAASAISDNARYISTNGSATDIQIVAFANTDGYGVVLMNTSDNVKNIKVKEGSHEFVATLPAWSVGSYRW